MHELMHKLAAQAMGYRAEYRAGDFPYLSILFAFAGWILLSPGAVRVTGIAKPLSGRANGIISLAGPATNLVLALAFYPLSGFGGILGEVGRFGCSINAYLAVFNMVPAPGFDGYGIWAWNKAFYLAFAALAVLIASAL